MAGQIIACAKPLTHQKASMAVASAHKGMAILVRAETNSPKKIILRGLTRSLIIPQINCPAQYVIKLPVLTRPAAVFVMPVSAVIPTIAAP